MKNIVVLDGEKMLIKVGDELDHHVTEGLKKQIDEAIEKSNISNVAFDFSETRFMDSSGVGLLMGRYKKIMRNGGYISIVGSNQAIDRILRISGIYKIVRMENV